SPAAHQPSAQPGGLFLGKKGDGDAPPHRGHRRPKGRTGGRHQVVAWKELGAGPSRRRPPRVPRACRGRFSQRRGKPDRPVHGEDERVESVKSDKPVGKKLGWKVVESTHPYSNPWIKLRSDKLDVKGSPVQYSYLEHPGGVMVVPVTAKGEIILIRQ